MRTRRQSRAGFAALLLVFALAASAAVMLYLEMPRVLFNGQREKEELLIERGEQYKRAIQVFVRKNKRYPVTIEELERFQDNRFLRRRYKDPLTGKDEWRLIHFENGSFRDSLVYKQKDPLEKEKSKEPGLVGEIPFTPQGDAQAGPIAAGLRTRGSDRPAAVSGMPQNYAPQPGDPGAPPPPVPLEGDPNDPARLAAQQAAQQQFPQQQGFQPQVGQSPFPQQQVGQSQFPQQQPQEGAPGQPIPIPFAPGMANPFQAGIQQQQAQLQQLAIQQQQQRQQQQTSFIGGSGSFIGGSIAPQQAPGGTPFGPAGTRVPVSSQGGGAYPNPVPGAPGARPGQPGAPGAPGAPGSNQAIDLIRNILTTPRPGGLPGAAAQGPAGLGSGIAGVATKVDSEGIKIYAERTNYKEWEFIYDQSQDKSAQLAAQGQAQPGQGQPGQGPLGPGLGGQQRQGALTPGTPQQPFGGQPPPQQTSQPTAPSFIGGPIPTPGGRK